MELDLVEGRSIPLEFCNQRSVIDVWKRGDYHHSDGAWGRTPICSSLLRRQIHLFNCRGNASLQGLFEGLDD